MGTRHQARKSSCKTIEDWIDLPPHVSFALALTIPEEDVMHKSIHQRSGGEGAQREEVGREGAPGRDGCLPSEHCGGGDQSVPWPMASALAARGLLVFNDIALVGIG